ncbi:MAG: hypothetical protein Q8O83_05240 [bacterium]|nr:hypothetical protein [bacterium]
MAKRYQKWNGKESVLEAVRKRAEDGKAMDSTSVCSDDKRLYSISNYYFGGWGKAVTAAGFGYDAIRIYRPKYWWGKEWTKERITQEIKNRYIDGKKINSNAIQVGCNDLYIAAKRYFGSWKNAIEAAGFDYQKTHRILTRSWDKKKIIQVIRERHRDNLPLNGFAVYHQDRGLYVATKRYFGKGGWRKALRLAGFDWRDFSPNRKWFKGDIISEIKMLHGYSIPLYENYLRRHGYGKMISGARKLFGSWEKAIESAGFSFDEVRCGERWSKKKVVERIRKLAGEGRRLNHKSIRMQFSRLMHAAIRYYGSWSQAVYAAGIDYKTHCVIWSSKAYLRSLKKEDRDTIRERFIDIIQKK